MSTIFCPNSIDWGDVATWVSGVATLGVGILAWRSSQRAVAIAGEASKISENQLDEARRERSEGSRIIGRLLLNEVSSLPVRAEGILSAFACSFNWSNGKIDNEAALEYALKSCTQALLPSAEGMLNRIHLLPDSLGADLATLIGSAQSIKAAAQFVSLGVRPHPSSNVVTYAGGRDSLVGLRSQLFAITQMSTMFAHEFQGYVGIGKQDYSKVVERLQALRSKLKIDAPDGL